MVICLLGLLLLAACGIALRPFVRRVSRSGTTVAEPMVDVMLEPVDLQLLPEPPVLPAAAVQILERAEIFRRLRELELGVAELGQPLPEHERIVTAALAAFDDPATQRKYFPRRPNLLPQLMHAINDENVSRRQLTAIFARDPSLVGSLLKMANSPYYRVTLQPVESIERAIVILGSDGLRSVIASVLMQPIFQLPSTVGFARFPEIVWEHALRSAHAAIPHAALVERVDAFAAELLNLITGLAEIVLFRAAMDHCAKSGREAQPAPQVIASLLGSHAATFAWRIAASWQLSELMLGALEEQMMDSEPTTALGRSLRFGRCAGALAVLHANSMIDDATVRLSLPEAGLSPAHLKCMWTRLLHKQEDPRAAGRMVA
jgi:HD-like signal output (HDOD) protein